tara:strand:+ start:907 stop:1506 length:600 start_codon:yes stop_codon:yes gene_type:complete
VTQKKILKSFLFLFSLTILIFIFKIYLNKNLKVKKIDLKANSNNDIIQTKKNKEANIIKDIIYTTKDKNGNQYIINAEYGSIDSKNSAIIDMTGVTSTVYLKDKNKILITSEKAVYDDLSYDTKFIENVVVTYESNKIEANNLNLYFSKNLMSAYNKVVYNNGNIVLSADQIDMDLTTKDIKTFMYNFLDTVSVNSKKN